MGEGGFNLGLTKLLFCVLKCVGDYLVRYWMLDHSRSVLFYVRCVCSVYCVPKKPACLTNDAKRLG